MKPQHAFSKKRAHYFAYQLNSKAKQTLATYRCLADDVKATITKEVVLAYPDFSKPFEIYTDASTKQLGAVITQDNRPIAFFSRKLSEFSHPKQRECLGHDATYKHLFKRNAVIDQGLEIKLIENTLCDCKDSRLVIPKPLQRQAVLWHHHHLQYPGHTRLKETMNSVMHWKGMRTTIRSLTRSCKTCQINKRRNY